MIVFVNFIKHIFAVVPPGFFIANKLKHGRKKLKENAHPFEGANICTCQDLQFTHIQGIAIQM